MLTGKVDFILTGEDSDIGFESTVVDLTGEIPILLRMGGISFNALIQVFPLIKKLDTEIDYAKPASPGLKYSFFIDCDQKKIRKAFCEYPIQDEFEEVIVNRIQKAALK